MPEMTRKGRFLNGSMYDIEKITSPEGELISLVVNVTTILGKQYRLLKSPLVPESDSLNGKFERRIVYRRETWATIHKMPIKKTRGRKPGSTIENGAGVVRVEVTINGLDRLIEILEKITK